MNFEWLKKHPYAAAGGALALLVIFVLVLRRSGSSGGGLDSAITQQNQGQLQMAQLNAQLSSQSDQTQAELASQEFSTQAQEQENQDQLAANVAATIIPQQLESNLYENQIAAAEAEQTQLLPLEEEAQGQIGKGGSLEGTGVDELALLLGEESAAQFPVKGQTGPLQAAPPTGFGGSFGFGPISLGLFG